MKIIQMEFDKPLKGRTEGVVVRANTEMSTKSPKRQRNLPKRIIPAKIIYYL